MFQCNGLALKCIVLNVPCCSFIRSGLYKVQVFSAKTKLRFDTLEEERFITSENEKLLICNTTDFSIAPSSLGSLLWKINISGSAGCGSCTKLGPLAYAQTLRFRALFFAYNFDTFVFMYKTIEKLNVGKLKVGDFECC